MESKAGGSGIWKNPAELSKNAVLAPAERTGEVQRLLRDLFGKLRHQCVCEESHCALRSGAQSLSGDPAPPCQSPGRCQVCLAFEAQPTELYGKCLATKNQRMNLLLCCCPAIAKIFRLSKAPAAMSADDSHKHELDIRNLLGALVQCGENRLNCMRNIGDLAEITPRLLCVQLRNGHSEFWNSLRTVAKVVNKQPTVEAKLAALIALRKLVPPGNHWSFYLASTEENAPAELDILRRWTQAVSQSASAAPDSSSSRPDPQVQHWQLPVSLCLSTALPRLAWQATEPTRREQQQKKKSRRVSLPWAACCFCCRDCTLPGQSCKEREHLKKKTNKQQK